MYSPTETEAFMQVLAQKPGVSTLKNLKNKSIVKNFDYDPDSIGASLYGKEFNVHNKLAPTGLTAKVIGIVPGSSIETEDLITRGYQPVSRLDQETKLKNKGALIKALTVLHDHGVVHGDLTNGMHIHPVSGHVKFTNFDNCCLDDDENTESFAENPQSDLREVDIRELVKILNAKDSGK